MKKNRAGAEAKAKIAESTVRRLSLYLRFLQEAQAAGEATISSDARRHNFGAGAEGSLHFRLVR